jgi:hypothetical protein
MDVAEFENSPKLITLEEWKAEVINGLLNKVH